MIDNRYEPNALQVCKNECHLTGRQIQVLQEVASGKSNKEIGIQLRISERTVKFHVQSLCSVLGLKHNCNRVLLTRLAIKFGFVEI
jgi:DNA-binding NarL/FixJ family response regulator